MVIFRKYRQLWTRVVSCVLLGIFLISGAIAPVCYAVGQDLLPVPGTRIAFSSTVTPPMLTGIRLYPEDPFRFDFILDQGDSPAPATDTQRLIKYFLASLTIPEEDLWVNLSPYEKDRIVPESFGRTEMGRDVLAQDYILKQVAASVIYPEDVIGKEFWDRVYAEAFKRYGTTEVPLDTFNKVWIVPEKATVYENQTAAFVVDSRLKVLLETDYRATLQSSLSSRSVERMPSEIVQGVVREIVLPLLETEVNQGRHFAQLRQVYHSLILATWVKRKIKSGGIAQVYFNQQKVDGLACGNESSLVSATVCSFSPEKTWELYLEAFQKGVYNYIKEEVDPFTRQSLPRKYFSGGATLGLIASGAFSVITDAARLPKGIPDHAMIVRADLRPIDPVMMELSLKEVVDNSLDILSRFDVFEDRFQLVTPDGDVQIKSGYLAYRLSRDIAELMANAFDEQKEGMIEVRLEHDNVRQKGLVRVTNKGMIDYEALRLRAVAVAEENKLYETYRGKILADPGAFFEKDDMYKFLVPVERAKRLSDAELLWAYKLGREKSRKNKEYGGRGVGLHNIRQDIEENGGSISVISADGATTVELAFDLADKDRGNARWLFQPSQELSRRIARFVQDSRIDGLLRKHKDDLKWTVYAKMIAPLKEYVQHEPDLRDDFEVVERVLSFAPGKAAVLLLGVSEAVLKRLSDIQTKEWMSQMRMELFNLSLTSLAEIREVGRSYMSSATTQEERDWWRDLLEVNNDQQESSVSQDKYLDQYRIFTDEVEAFVLLTGEKFRAAATDWLAKEAKRELSAEQRAEIERFLPLLDDDWKRPRRQGVQTLYDLKRSLKKNESYPFVAYASASRVTKLLQRSGFKAQFVHRKDSLSGKGYYYTKVMIAETWFIVDLVADQHEPLDDGGLTEEDSLPNYWNTGVVLLPEALVHSHEYRERLPFYSLWHEVDAAMSSKNVEITSPGGIDLTPGLLDLQTVRDEGTTAAFIDPFTWQQLKSASGLTPVILDIRPMAVTVQGFLGTNDPPGVW